VEVDCWASFVENLKKSIRSCRSRFRGSAEASLVVGMLRLVGMLK